jgi:predicted membrane chloride channel (bestrophin family)
MNTLTEIEVAIQQLPASNVRELALWLEEYLEAQWDRQILQDYQSGNLDRLINRAEADIKANRVKPLIASFDYSL